MQIDIITLFTEIFEGVFEESIVKRAQESNQISIRLVNLRDYSNYKRDKADDRPFGGGPGMVLRPQPIFDAVEDFKSSKSTVILLSPQGDKYAQGIASELSTREHIILICGRYEGVDERVREYLIDREISIGDYVLSGGEIPAMVVVESVVRLIPGVLGNRKSSKEETFAQKFIEYPQYTRPADFRGMKVPKVLLSGNHKKIKRWRKKQSMKKTKKRRPELIKDSRRDKDGKRN